MPRISQCCGAEIGSYQSGAYHFCSKCQKSCCGGNTVDEASYKAGLEAGRQEVVDWINESTIHSLSDWEAKLKARMEVADA